MKNKKNPRNSFFQPFHGKQTVKPEDSSGQQQTEQTQNRNSQKLSTIVKYGYVPWSSRRNVTIQRAIITGRNFCQRLRGGIEDRNHEKYQKKNKRKLDGHSRNYTCSSIKCRNHENYNIYTYIWVTFALVSKGRHKYFLFTRWSHSFSYYAMWLCTRYNCCTS